MVFFKRLVPISKTRVSIFLDDVAPVRPSARAASMLGAGLGALSSLGLGWAHLTSSSRVPGCGDAGSSTAAAAEACGPTPPAPRRAAAPCRSGGKARKPLQRQDCRGLGVSLRLSLKDKSPFSGQAGHSGWGKATVRVRPESPEGPRARPFATWCPAEVAVGAHVQAGFCRGISVSSHFPTLL